MYTVTAEMVFNADFKTTYKYEFLDLSDSYDIILDLVDKGYTVIVKKD